MDKYLKMADYFDQGDVLVDGSSLHDASGVVAKVFGPCAYAKYVAHAINSHDELVAKNERLRGMVIRMQSCLDMAGEYPEKESDNPVRKWLFDAIDCTR